MWAIKSETAAEKYSIIRRAPVLTRQFDNSCLQYYFDRMEQRRALRLKGRFPGAIETEVLTEFGVIAVSCRRELASLRVPRLVFRKIWRSAV